VPTHFCFLSGANIMRKSLGVLLAAALAALFSMDVDVDVAAAADADPSARLDLPLVVHKLPNGLTVVLEEDHHVPLVSVLTRYDTGFAADPAGRGGMAHLFEHLLALRTQHAPQVFAMLQAAGSSDNNAWTDFDSNGYYETVPPTALRFALWLESERMAFGDVGDDAFRTQRSVIENEAKQRYETVPYGYVFARERERLFPESHPYHHFGGDPRELAPAQAGEAAAFYQAHYAPGNAVLVVVGDFRTAEAMSTIDQYFGSLPARPVTPKTAPPPVVLDGEQRLDLSANVGQRLLSVAWPVPGMFQPGSGTDELFLAARVLGGTPQSRLPLRLVQGSSIADQVSAAYIGGQFASELRIEVLLRPGHGADEALGVIDEELARLRKAPMSDAELARIRAPFVLGYLSSLESSLARAQLFAQYWQLTGDPGFLPRDFAQLQAVSPEGLRAAVDTLLPARRRLVTRVEPDKDAPIFGIVTPAVSPTATPAAGASR
jgi:predicted Zn-dependent peptidase